MPRRTTIWRCRRALNALTYEAHLLQHGLASFTLQYPWFGIPLGALVLPLIWTLYWGFYCLLLLLTLPALLVLPLELHVARRR